MPSLSKPSAVCLSGLNALTAFLSLETFTVPSP